jgi:DNA N-6-adenine-methyltransferase (Dam)
MTDSYATPLWLLDIFSSWYDPCPLDDEPKINGLLLEWKEKTYVNPPYSNPLPWVKKAIEEMNKGNTIVMLLRADSSTKYFQLCQEHGEVLYFGRRIKFNGKTPYFASMLVIFNGNDHVQSGAERK